MRTIAPQCHARDWILPDCHSPYLTLVINALTELFFHKIWKFQK